MNAVERLVLSKMLGAMTDEQRAEMIASIRAESGRAKRAARTFDDIIEDEAIAIIEVGFFDRY